MELVYGCLSVEGTSWTHPDNIALQVVNTVSYYNSYRLFYNSIIDDWSI